MPKAELLAVVVELEAVAAAEEAGTAVVATGLLMAEKAVAGGFGTEEAVETKGTPKGARVEAGVGAGAGAEHDVSVAGLLEFGVKPENTFAGFDGSEKCLRLLKVLSCISNACLSHQR